MPVDLQRISFVWMRLSVNLMWCVTNFKNPKRTILISFFYLITLEVTTMQPVLWMQMNNNRKVSARETERERVSDPMWVVWVFAVVMDIKNHTRNVCKKMCMVQRQFETEEHRRYKLTGGNSTSSCIKNDTIQAKEQKKKHRSVYTEIVWGLCFTKMPPLKYNSLNSNWNWKLVCLKRRRTREV